MKQLKKQKEEFNGILNDASVRTKMPSSDKVITQDEMHWLKTLIFTHLRFIKAVASDQHNYANSIRMIKGVHKLRLLPNMLISLIDQFTIFNGWMDGQPGRPRRGSRTFCQGGPGPTARIVIRTWCQYIRTHTYIGLHTYICMYRQAHETKLFHFHRSMEGV